MAAHSVTLRLEAYNQDARRLVAAAQALADTREHGEVEPLHLLYTLVDQDESARATIGKVGADPDDVLVEGEVCLRRLPKRAGPAYLSPRMLDLLGRAEGEASRQGGVPVSTGHLLLATAQASGGDARIVLSACGISAPVLRAQLSSTERSDAPTDRRAGRHAIDLTQQARQGRFDPIVGRDVELRRVMQVLARRGANNPLLVGEPGVGRHSIVRALCQRIATDDVPTLLQGKRVLEVDTTALLTGARSRGEMEERLARFLSGVRDSAGEVIAYFRDLDTLLGERGIPMGRHLLASALREGEMRALVLADPATHRRLIEGHELGRHLVTIDVAPPDEAGTIAILRALVGRLETAHGLSIADPALVAAARLSRRYVRAAQQPKSAVDLIDESAARLRVEMQSMPAELDQCLRRLEAVQIQLASLDDDEDLASRSSQAALQASREQLHTRIADLRAHWQRELDARAQVTNLREEIAALEQELAELPSDSPRAEELRMGSLYTLQTQLSEAQACLPGDDAMVRDTVCEADVAAVVADWTGIPVTRMLEEETDKLLHMEARLATRVIGQARAVAAISRAVRRSRAGLRDGKRPIGSFLFLGASGVGKTELAKALAEFLFDDEGALTRLDMSEFMEKHTVARLLGAPPGYADSEEGGFLTEAIRHRPYSVLLFDEVEKAHPDVFNILLQVLDDGRLTDSRGRLSHFSDCVVIMTSNLGAHHILAHAAQGDGDVDQLREKLDEALAGHFRPEFLNRIDDIVTFDVLSRDDLGAILDLQLAQLSRMLERRGLSLAVSGTAKAHLVELGYDPAFGARPLKRVLQRELQDPMSEALLGGAYPAGATLRVDLEAGALTFEAAPEDPAR